MIEKDIKKSDEKKLKLSRPIYIAAHQLKSPISVLRGYLEVLLSEDFGMINEKQREYLNDALSNVERIMTTVENFLDVAKIEEKKYKIKQEPVDLVKITEEVITYLTPWARAANCKIIFNQPQNLPLVCADLFKIRQVIENLLSNAIKYRSTGPGEVEIIIKEKGKKVIFSCRDNGIGIPKKDFSKIFSKFYRSENALEIDPSGVGLGLYINKAIIEASGGKIWFKKNAAGGMTFYFSLPSHKF